MTIYCTERSPPFHEIKRANRLRGWLRVMQYAPALIAMPEGDA
jgi:hypothetical protein